MAKLGLARHRYAVAILCSLYVIVCTLSHIYSIFDTFYGSIFVISVINLAIGCFGLYSLYKENATLMKIFGIILIIKVVLLVLEVLGLIMLLLLRESVLNVFLKSLMDRYYDDVIDREIMDDIQTKLECCGRQSYNDWTIQPYSCCKTSDCTAYYEDGCVIGLSSVTSYILLAYGLLSIFSIFLHIYALVSAFELARVYRQGPIRPTIKHGFANF